MPRPSNGRSRVSNSSRSRARRFPIRGRISSARAASRTRGRFGTPRVGTKSSGSATHTRSRIGSLKPVQNGNTTFPKKKFGKFVVNKFGKSKKQSSRRSKELNVSGHYGYSTQTNQVSVPGTDVIPVIIQLDYYSLVRLVFPLIFHACNHGADTEYGADPNSLYAAYFLTEYLREEWTGEVHSHILSVAPAIFWDLCDAGTKRVCGNYSYQFTINYVDPATAMSGASSTLGGPLGNPTAATTDNYTTVDVTTAGYTAELGHTAATAIIQRAAKILHAVPRDSYKEIKSDDPSIFHSTSTSNYFVSAGPYIFTGSTLYDDTGAFNSKQYYPSTNVSFQKPQCMWLHRLTMTRITEPVGDGSNLGKYMSTSHCGNSAIIIHRVLHGLKGYHRHKDRVYLKTLRFSAYMNLFSAYAMRVDAISGLTIPATEVFDQNEAKYFFANFLFAHFKTWAAAGVAAMVTSDAASVDNRFLVGGAGHGQSANWNQQTIYAPFAKMLAHMYPTEDRATNEYYYPMLVMDRLALTTTPWTANASGTLTVTWNHWTNLTATGGKEVSLANLPALGALMTKWQSFMAKSEMFTPICGHLPLAPVSFTNCTWTVLTTACTAIYFMASKKYDPQLRDLMASCVVPEVISTADGNYMRKTMTAAQSAYNEPLRQWYNNNDELQEVMIMKRLTRAIHDKFNKGSEDANTVVTAPDVMADVATMANPIVGSVAGYFGSAVMGALVSSFPAVADNLLGRVVDRGVNQPYVRGRNEEIARHQRAVHDGLDRYRGMARDEL